MKPSDTITNDLDTIQNDTLKKNTKSGVGLFRMCNTRIYPLCPLKQHNPSCKILQNAS